MQEQEIIKTMQDKFSELYGEGDSALYFAPGRVNLACISVRVDAGNLRGSAQEGRPDDSHGVPEHE